MSDTPFVVTKKSLGLAGMAAFAACAACCALPVLAAAGIGGGALSAVAGYIRPGADLVVASLVGVGVLAFIALRARARARALPGANSNFSCDVGGGCGCAPPGNTNIFATESPRSGEPIVCTADLRDQPTVQGQLDGYRAAFEHLLRTEKVDGAVRWIFANRPGLGVDLRTLARKEHQCCSFFKFNLRIDGETIVWETTAHADGAAVLDEFARLPDRLSQHSRGGEVHPIKEAIGRAGLIFAADAPPPNNSSRVNPGSQRNDRYLPKQNINRPKADCSMGFRRR